MVNRLFAKVLSYRWIVYGVMSAVYISAFFQRVSPAVVALDIQESLQLSASMVGLLSSAYFYSYAAIQFPAGILSDTLGPRRSVALFLVVAAVGSMLFGWAPGLGVAVVGRVLVGMGAGMAWTPSMKIISHWFRRDEFSTMSGLMLAMGGVGALIAAAPLAWLNTLLGWQLAFELIGLATLALAVMVWIVVRDRPEDLGLPKLVDDDARPAAQLGPWEGVRRVVTEKYFWPPVIWTFFIMGSYFTFAGLWGGPYLIHVYGMSPSQAGSVMNMLAVGIVLGSPLWSYVSEKLFKSRKKVLMTASGAYMALLGVLNLFPQELSLGSLYVAFLAFSLCGLAPAAVAITTTKELFPVEITGTSIGTVNLFPFVGTAVMQVGTGWLLDSYARPTAGTYSVEAYSGVMLFLLAAAVVGFASTFFMKETFSGS
jgi:sugar phosphate permease